MLLLLKYKYGLDELHINKIVLYTLFLFIITYFSKSLFVLICILDIYIYTILTNFKLQSNNKPRTNSSVKMEIVAEGVTKTESDNLLNTLIEYSDKLCMEGNKVNK